MAFIDDMVDATPFHTPRWCAAVERATGHRFHRLVARDAGGRIIGWLPLHHIRSRLFGDALVSSGFAVGGGILAEDQWVADSLAEAAVALAGSLGVGSIELRGGMTPSGWAVDETTNVGFARPLAASREAELAAIPRKHRAEVRKALDRDFTVTTGRDPALMAQHYALYAESVRNLGTPVFPRALFREVAAAFGEHADALVIAHAGQGVSAVLSLYWRGTVMPYWGGGNAGARALRGNERLYFELMDHARARGMTSFDFGRSKAGSGPAAYKRNWGFEAAALRYASWSATGKPRETSAQSPRYQQMIALWQRLPLWLANRMGPLIARQLG